MPSKISELNQEDLARWRMASADKELVDNGFPGMSVDEGRRAILNYYRLLGEFLSLYNLNAEDGSVFLSPIDGGFYRLMGVD